MKKNSRRKRSNLAHVNSNISEKKNSIARITGEQPYFHGDPLIRVKQRKKGVEIFL